MPRVASIEICTEQQQSLQELVEISRLSTSFSVLFNPQGRDVVNWSMRGSSDAGLFFVMCICHLHLWEI